MPDSIPAAVVTLALLGSSVAGAASHVPGRSEYRAPLAAAAPVVDGVADEAAWNRAEWRSIGETWLGPDYTADDFSGRFKVVWTRDRIYLLVEIVDDILYDAHRDPFQQYWDDDCLEIFIDEDHSGGEHRFNHNAFAYHFSLDNRAIDLDTTGKPREYSHHVQSQWRQVDGRIVWEVAIDIYPDAYADDSDDNRPVALAGGKVMGLMVAYCDNDGSELRENFVGSEAVPTGPKDRGYIDADIFGTLVLSE